MDDRDEQREAALKRVKGRRDFRNHVAAYLIVNTMLVLIWAFSGAGYFWPIWIIAAWGIGLAFHAWAGGPRTSRSRQHRTRSAGRWDRAPEQTLAARTVRECWIAVTGRSAE